MAETTPFKDGINADVARYYGDGLSAIRPDFDGAAFVSDVMAGLDSRELKARVQHVAAVLWSHLGPDFPAAIAALMELLEQRERPDGPAFQFTHWPMARFVQDYGLEHLELSVAAMERITSHFSCEFAVRPFLVRYPEEMLAVMHRWAAHPSVHVRRNASEGIRPRLPWGQQLRAFIEDPTPVIGVLERLRKDPEEYVRRSVSNGLNDIAKDHPQRLMALLERWDQDPDEHSEWIKRRALRTLVKAGDPRALSLLGFGPPHVRLDGLHLDAAAFTVGDSMILQFALLSEAEAPQTLAVDYRVHFVKANGTRRPKVFKLKTLTLQPGQRVEIARTQHLRPISTRRYHPGTHAVDVQVNGQVMGLVEFELTL